VMLGVLGALGLTDASAADDLPRTFIGCVAEGGDVRAHGDELTCRLTRSYDFRVYGTTTTECGETIEVEIWGETRKGVVTYAFAPGRTVELSELGLEGMALPEDPPPCLDD
jgi:hypothetical protein